MATKTLTASGLRREKAALMLDAATAAPIWAASPVMRPWHMRWGATADEVLAAMPGDDVVPRAQFNATRAITIQVPPERVWPWIAQLGYDRAGFYTYDLLDNGGNRSAEQVLPQYQALHPGDQIPMWHEYQWYAAAIP